jgi:DNA-binding CsgD family transcriptional regulator
MMPAFLNFITATRRAKSVDALFEIFIETMHSLGFDHINFSVIAAYDISNNHWGFGRINTYPGVWRQYYEVNNCRRIDPVARCATSTFRPFYWSELERILPLTARQRRFLREAQKAGLHNGVGIPFKGPMSQVAGIALATSELVVNELPPLDLIVAYCNQFFEVFRAFVATPPSLPRAAILSDKECQVLEGIVKSLTDAQIAEMMGIKSSTVDSHLRSIFRKLMVRNRTAAVMSAQKMGLIDL